MDQNELRRSRRARTGLCLVLILALLLGLCYPAIKLETVAPEDPLEDQQIQDIGMLVVGAQEIGREQSGENDESSDLTEPEETMEPTHPQETEPEETMEPTQSRETEPEETTEPTQPQETEPEETTEPTQPQETEPEETTEPTQPQTTEPQETEPEETTEPQETEPRETEPQATEPGATKPEDEDNEDPTTGDGENGQEDGSQGEEGGEEMELALAAVMTWYKYGTQPKTIVCGPSERVGKTLNTAQLVNDELKYAFSLTGEDADNVRITAVWVKAGDGEFVETAEAGSAAIDLPNPETGRDYTFRVDARMETRDAQGNLVEQDISFTYVLHCVRLLDLELELSWKKDDGSTAKATCVADGTAAKTVESTELTENVFAYSTKLVGALAEDARITKAEYTTASGLVGILNEESGSLVFQTAIGSDEETYYFTFEAQVGDGTDAVQTVCYHVTIVFRETLDIQLSFTWLERGTVRRTMICQPDESVSTDVKNNQLSAGAVKYEMELTGADSENAVLLNISYTSEASGGGKLDASGALPMTLPDGTTSNTYTVLAVVLAKGQQLRYEIVLRYAMDVSLEMTYSVMENGVPAARSVSCENGKTKTAEAVYDDQLTDGMLAYRLAIAGSDGTSLVITSVTCYQSGSSRTVTLESEGSLQLLLKNGKTGENTFTVTAADSAGTAYQFRISIPYKHRGENSVRILTNLTDGQTVTNEANTNLNVRAWSEDGSGNTVSYIPANGVDTKLIVKLDGVELRYVSSSGPASEYILCPSNPVTGDTNTHTLYIYAEDPYGNYGELTLTLRGQRSMAGQKKGNATIYIDMTALGLGVVDSVSYEVLADEPISYSIAKAVLGMDTGDPFGAAANSLGWSGDYSGRLDEGFYLKRLTPGYTANALGASSWSKYGANDEEILAAIDSYFGKGTGLATLWRCIYRNGLTKFSGSDGSYGEFDYTSGSGWLYSLNGTYYPGLSMSEYSLENGDVLTLRYTLAFGWDVGGGTTGYGNTIGYCVTAMNGKFYIDHQMETVEMENGAHCSVCRCCGMVEECAHKHAYSMDLDDGTHVKYCDDCKTAIGDPEEHIWDCAEEAHTCSACGAGEAHTWKEVQGSNTATCTEPGTRTVYCTVCGMTKEEESPAKGHTLNNRWNHTETEHYQKCSTCGQVIAESCGGHQYEYDTGDDDWYCKVCQAGHDWDYCGNDHLEVHSATCQKIVYYCAQCGMYLSREGSFPEYHAYVDGVCTHCGAADPDYTPPETDPPETEPPETDPPETEPPETDPPETQPPETDPGEEDPDGGEE